LLGPVSAATWAVALRFVEPLQLMAATTVGQFTLPIYARKQTDAAALEALYLSGTRRSSLLLVPMFVGLGACAGPVITLFVGPQWLVAQPLMAIICLVFAVIASRQLVEITLTSLAAPHLNLVIQAVAIALSLIGFAVGAQDGLLGATIGWAMRVLPFVTLAAWFLWRRAGISLAAQAATLGPIYAASGLMALAVITLQSSLLAGQPPIVMLIGSIVAGVVVYFAAALLLDRHTRSDLAMLRARRGA
jgi:O-antigen/teichoic acid export membrane protein